MKRADDTVTESSDGPGSSKRMKTSDPTNMEDQKVVSVAPDSTSDIHPDTTTTTTILEPQDNTEAENATHPNPKKDKNISRRQAASFAKSEIGKDKRKGKGKEGKEGKGKGSWGRRGTRNEEDDAQGQTQGPKAIRFPKKACALLIGFCGTGCKGMQVQKDCRTIEGVLFEAMVKAGAVSQDNADDPSKVGLGRAARTDAGVHAAGNVVSLKMITSVPGIPDMVARINEELPPEIRVWGFARVQNSFNARLSCDSRKYTYFFPTYLLIPPKPGCGLERALQRYTYTSSASTDPTPNPISYSSSHPFWTTGKPTTYQEDLLRKRSWRVDASQVERLREIAAEYLGNHNFHNFTVGREFRDPSNQRYMKKIEIADPAIYGDTEWISVLFHGQSFMLHQRKMMSALILACRTGTPPKVMNELYGPRVVFVPKMPALGLLLEEPIFDSYNGRVATISEGLTPDDSEYRPPIEFDQYRETINEFKQKHIYDNMRQIESRDGLFDAWVRSVDSYAGNDLLYLNPEGLIPTAAVITKGGRRENPFKERKKFDATSFEHKDSAKDGQDESEEEEEEAPLSKALLAESEG